MMCDHNFAAAAAAADYDGDKSVDEIDIDDDGTLNSQTMLYDFICIFCACGECDCHEQEH